MSSSPAAKLSTCGQTTRVLHVADSWTGGGAETVFRQTVDASQRLGHVTRVLTGTKTRNPFSYVFSFQSARRIHAAIVEFRPDVIHLQNYYHHLSPAVLWAIRRLRRKGTNVRVVFTAHDFHLICPNSGLQHFHQGRMSLIPENISAIPILDRYDHRSWIHSWLKICQFALAYRALNLHKQIDEILCPSHFMADMLARHVAKTPITIVRNPLDSAAFENDPIDALVARAQTTVSDVLKIGFIGRLSQEKGLASFFRTLRDVQLPWEFHVYGDGPQRGELVAEVQRLGITNRVLFHGTIPHSRVMATLKTLSVVVSPSCWYENAPLSVLEAAAAGTPTLVNPLGGLTEMSKLTAVSEARQMDDATQITEVLRNLWRQQGTNRILSPTEFMPETYARALSSAYTRRGKRSS